jgi:hypothetical protein
LFPIRTVIGLGLGTRLFDGDSFDPSPAADLEYGLVIEWLNGLDSLANALMAPEPVDAA